MTTIAPTEIEAETTGAVVDDERPFTLEEPPIGEPVKVKKPRVATGRRNVAEVWVTYNEGSEGAIAQGFYADELEARRTAMAGSLSVIDVTWGSTLRQAIDRNRAS